MHKYKPTELCIEGEVSKFALLIIKLAALAAAPDPFSHASTWLDVQPSLIMHDQAKNNTHLMSAEEPVAELCLLYFHYTGNRFHTEWLLIWIINTSWDINATVSSKHQYLISCNLALT